MTSGFRGLHPLPCLLYYIAVMLLAMLLLHPLFLTPAIGLLIAVSVRYEPPGKLLRIVGLYLLVGLVLFLLNPLFSHRGEHILFYMWDQPITLEAVVYGLTIALSTLTLFFAFLSFRHVLPGDKFLYLFGRLWPTGALLAVMALRFVPLLRRRLALITAVQRAKGVSMTEGSLRKRIRSGTLLLQILLTWSLEEALQTADSMRARGYGLRERSSYRAYRMRGRDWRVALFIALCAGVCVALWLGGHGRLPIYPRLGDPWLTEAGDGVALGAFLLLVGLPLWIEGREWLRWRYSS